MFLGGHKVAKILYIGLPIIYRAPYIGYMPNSDPWGPHMTRVMTIFIKAYIL